MSTMCCPDVSKHLKEELQQLGLQGLFAEVPYIILMLIRLDSGRTRLEDFERGKETFQAIANFLKKALTGLKLDQQRPVKGFEGIVSSFSEAVEVEAAYYLIRPILGEPGPEECEYKLQWCLTLVEKLLNEQPVPQSEMQALKDFSEYVVSYLQNQYYERLEKSRGMWPTE